MNKNLAIAIGVIVVIVLAGVVMIPALFPPKTSMTVTFYDADDNIIWSEKTDYGLFEFGFVTEAGVEVSKAVVTVDYIVEGYEPLNTLYTKCTFYISARLRTITGGLAGNEAHTTPVKSGSTGSFSREFLLDYIIGVESTGKEWGWRINVVATLECDEYDASTSEFLRSALPWEDSLGFNLDWSEPAAFAIVGSNFNFGPT